MKLFLCTIFFSTLAATCFAQVKPLQGLVIDRDTKQRLAKVYIYNMSSGDGLYNNTKGEFYTNAKLGDTLVAALSGYGVDTLVFRGQAAVYFQLKSFGIRLKDVQIQRKKLTPQQKYEETLSDNRYAILRGSSKDILVTSDQGAGLGIDAIYNLLSRQGRDARYLQKVLEKDYKEQVIDYRFTPNLVSQVLGIEGEERNDFMLQYRPTYQFVLDADDYAFNLFIKNAYKSYRINPTLLRLPSLPPLIPKQR